MHHLYLVNQTTLHFLTSHVRSGTHLNAATAAPRISNQLTWQAFHWPLNLYSSSFGIPLPLAGSCPPAHANMATLYFMFHHNWTSESEKSRTQWHHHSATFHTIASVYHHDHIYLYTEQFDFTLCGCEFRRQRLPLQQHPEVIQALYSDHSKPKGSRGMKNKK